MIYKTTSLIFIVATSIYPQLVYSVENKVLECTVQESNGKAFSYEIGKVVTMPIANFSVSSDGQALFYNNERSQEKFVVSRKTGKFEWVIGESTSRFSANEPTRMSGICILKEEKLKF